MKSSILRLSAVAMSLALTLSAHAVSAFTGLHAFGDSLSDSGNLYQATGGLLPDNPDGLTGRFGNGPTWVEKLAFDYLELPVFSNSLAGGTNHAYGGAWTDGGGAPIPTVVDQIDAFTGGGGSFAPTDLVTIWAGANDFLGGVTDSSVPVANISTALGMLAAAGAENILVLNLPDLGKTPNVQSQGAAAIAGITALVNGFNGLLATEIANQRTNLGVDIFELDIYSLNEDFVANPGIYGFLNTTDQASQNLVDDADTYLYWDGLHPTDAAHEIFASKAAQAAGIPEPSSALLVMSASLVIIRRRRKLAA